MDLIKTLNRANCYTSQDRKAVSDAVCEIESLRAKIQEQAAEIERYKASPTVETCRQMISDQAVKEASALHDQLTAEQNKVKVLTAAATHVVTNGVGTHSIQTLMNALATVKEVQ